MRAAGVQAVRRLLLHLWDGETTAQFMGKQPCLGEQVGVGRWLPWGGGGGGGGSGADQGGPLGF